MQRVGLICLCVGVALWVIGFLAYGLGVNMPLVYQSQEWSFGLVMGMLLAFVIGTVSLASGLLLMVIAVIRKTVTRAKHPG